jgi:hypothetical protein
MKLEYIRILLKERIEADHDKWLDYLKELSGLSPIAKGSIAVNVSDEDIMINLKNKTFSFENALMTYESVKPEKDSFRIEKKAEGSGHFILTDSNRLVEISDINFN